MAVASVTTAVEVNGQTGTESSPLEKATKLSAEQLKGSCNDPDEFRRQLLALAAAKGSQSNAIISVDGFQESSAIPPKDSILSVRTSPNPYTAELQYPVVDGGRLEITTKPGTPVLHGSFFNSSSSSLNTSDPYFLSSAPAGNQNVGIDLTGPVLHSKSGFGLSLERRSIREQNVVNEVGLSSALQMIPVLATVAAPVFSAPSLTVAGFFTGGGSQQGSLREQDNGAIQRNNRERRRRSVRTIPAKQLQQAGRDWQARLCD